MTNLKKTLAVVLAFAMILSMGAISTFAYTDVEAGTVVSEAVGILSNLSILTGFEDGTFRPDETVTRAQMAAIICRTLGYDDQAQSSMGSTVFNDVAADHWASGYINVAQAQGIINGYGDGNFGPEDQVTYEQAVKMIVSALGYDLAAQAKGGYPTGYLAIASAEGVTKNANGRVGDAAKRSAIAVLVYNSLEVRLMDQSSWTTNNEDEYTKTNETILSKYLEVKKWEGELQDVPTTLVANGTYDPDADKMMVLEGNYSYYSGGKLIKDNNGVAHKISAHSDLVNADEFIGKSVIAYIGEHDELGDNTVFALAESKGKNTVTTISAVQLVDATDSKAYNEAGVVSYRNTGSNRINEVDLASNVKFFVNYDETSLNGAATTTADIDGAIYAGGKIELISNDYDSEVEYVLITAYDYESVVKEVVEEDGLYTFKTYSGTDALDEIDTLDEDELTVVYVDGVLADAAALAADQTVSTVDVAKGYRILFASTATVTGTVDSYDPSENTVAIAGTDYEISPAFGVAANKLMDEEGIFYLNVDGEIAHNETEATGTSNYALVLAVWQENTGLNNGYFAQVALADGTIVEYEIGTNAKYYNASGSVVAPGTGVEDEKHVADTLVTALKGSAGTASTTVQKLDVATAPASVFKLSVRNGEITRVKALEGSAISSYASANTREYDADSMTYGSAEFDESTIVFALDNTSGTVTDEDLTAGKIADYFTDGDTFMFTALDIEDSVAPVVIGYDLTPSIPDDSYMVVVTGKKTITYDGEEAVQITGFQAGEEVSYIIYDEKDSYTTDPAGLAKGDVIMVGAANSEGVVNDCVMLFDKSASGLVAANTKGDKAEDIAVAYGILDKAKTTDSKFFLNVPVQNYEADGTTPATVFYSAAEGVPMRSNANYTLVDYTESATNPEVSRKSAGTSLFSTNSKYTSYVLVRVYDGAVYDVVVMRYEGAAVALSITNAGPSAAAAEDATVTATATSGATVKYSTDDGETWSATAPTGLKAGDKVLVKGEKTGYNTTIEEVTVPAYVAPET